MFSAYVLSTKCVFWPKNGPVPGWPVNGYVFVYDFGPDPSFGPPSRDLLQRIENGDLKGFVSAHVLHDVAHRLMTLEACQTFGWPYSGIAQRLRRHPLEIQKLHRFRQALDEILGIGVQVLPVSAGDVLLAGDLSRTHGLLSGDALILAVMQNCGVTNLASSDADFDRAPGITLRPALRLRNESTMDYLVSISPSAG